MSQVVVLETPAGTTARDLVDKLLKATELYGPNLEVKPSNVELVRWGVSPEGEPVKEKRQANK